MMAGAAQVLGGVALAATALVACGQVPQKAPQNVETSRSYPSTNIGTNQEASPDDIPGVVMAKLGDDEGLMILPIQDAPAYNRKATAGQVQACPMDARYPDCLRRRKRHDRGRQDRADRAGRLTPEPGVSQPEPCGWGTPSPW